MTMPVLYDTMTRAVKPLAPVDGRAFRFYCCGPTVYGPAHIGNFRTFILQDVFRRMLEAAGMKTLHVRNITDVDDKTIRQSMAEGKSLKEFTDYWLGQFHRDCEALNLLPPHVEPSAVGHITHQIRLIQELVSKGHAYAAQDGSVYFRVASYRDYGRLSQLASREITTSDAPSVQDADEYERESAADFALWKAHKPEDGPNKWPSPWGDGRPGWHMECSAMCHEYLGDSFDLHAGGVDLIFPHHENEIAQSTCATGGAFARHWFHSAHLLVEGRKMSKSLGNLYTLADIAERGFTATELRYVLLSGHYRQPLNFTWDSLHAARRALHRLQQIDEDLLRISGNGPIEPTADWGVFEASFDALLDNLNTPEALGRLFTAVHSLESKINALEMDASEARRQRAALQKMLGAFGLVIEPPIETEIPDDVRALAEQRWEARLARDFKRADILRAQLAERGWTVRDGRDGYELDRE